MSQVNHTRTAIILAEMAPRKPISLWSSGQRVAGGADLDSWLSLCYVERDGKGSRQMKHPAAIVSALCLMGLLSFSYAGAAGEGPLATGPTTAGAIGKLGPPAPRSDVAGRASSEPPGPSTPWNVFGNVPSISGDYSVGRSRLMPYIGAGFGSGYTSDLDRSLSGGPSIQANSGLRSLFGQGLTPNEFQMGIRVPF